MKYKPYLMKDVHAGEALNKFRVISTFAGGGGSLLPSLESKLSAPFRTQKRHPFRCLS